MLQHFPETRENILAATYVRSTHLWSVLQFVLQSEDVSDSLNYTAVTQQISATEMSVIVSVQRQTGLFCDMLPPTLSLCEFVSPGAGVVFFPHLFNLNV